MIGLLTQRRDGFVSLDAGPNGGVLTTRPFAVPKGDLRLNVDASAGEIRVEWLDASGTSLAESAPLRGDRPDAKATFRGAAPKPGAVARLRLTLRQAKLFSYWFA